VAGPRNHGQWNGDGTRLGAIDFASDTSLYYRENIAQPWFDCWLRGHGRLRLAEATTFETGTNQWRRYEEWPPKQRMAARRLYMSGDRRLSFDAPAPGPARLRRVHQRPGQPGSLPAASGYPYLPRPGMAHLPGRGPAVPRSPSRRPHLADRTPRGGRENSWRRHRHRLGGKVARRLPGRRAR